MIFQQGENSYDLTLMCTGIVEGIFCVSYILFAYRVTHTGDFYDIRRWKAAIWLAGITAAIFLVFLQLLINTYLLFLIITSHDIFLSVKSILDITKLDIVVLLIFLLPMIPFLYIITVGTHFQIKWWLDSDDYLDKLWKDPNEGHKNPIQEI